MNTHVTQSINPVEGLTVGFAQEHKSKCERRYEENLLDCITVGKLR